MGSADPLAPGTPDDAHVAEEEVHRTSLAVYATITLLGVTAAASWKKFVTDEPELIVTLVGASLAVVIAHAWSSVMAQRLVHGTRLSRRQVTTEIVVSLSFFIATGIAIAAIVLGQVVLDLEFVDTVLLTELVLVGALFVLGMLGARRAGTGWWRALAWGAVDASIGVVIMVLKLVLGG